MTRYEDALIEYLDPEGKEKDEEDKEPSILDQYMKGIKPDEVVYIGSGSGYLFIGTLKQYKVDFEQISDDCTKQLNKTVARLNGLVEHINEEIDKANQDLDGHELPKIKERLTKTKKTLYERIVLDSYKKVMEDEPGTAIIIRGSENGRFWLRSEYDRAKEERERREENG